MLLVKTASSSWISDCLAHRVLQTAQSLSPAALSTTATDLGFLWQNSLRKPICENSWDQWLLVLWLGGLNKEAASQGREYVLWCLLHWYWNISIIPEMQLLKGRYPVSSVWLGWVHQAGISASGAGTQMRVGAFPCCSNLTVSCPSLPVDDAKVRLFQAIWRKWKILSREIWAGRKASGAQHCRRDIQQISWKTWRPTWSHLVFINSLKSNTIRAYAGFQDF